MTPFDLFLLGLLTVIGLFALELLEEWPTWNRFADRAIDWILR